MSLPDDIKRLSYNITDRYDRGMIYSCNPISVCVRWFANTVLAATRFKSLYPVHCVNFTSKTRLNLNNLMHREAV